ncbi:hypothetical protein E8E14_000681 [Neopestalotiopsis sp. 37M]|nr:hypothetical protein E8E14_000681 [Neopestalotiopsis sp. 37M]
METATNMRNAQPAQPVIEFADEVPRISRPGVDGFGLPQQFVPYDALVAFWTPQRIGEVIRANNSLYGISWETVRNHYLRIFSTLAWSNRIEDFPRFTHQGFHDDNLPLSSRRSPWTDAPVFQVMFESFMANQWRFCPLVFARSRLANLEIQPEQILPFQQPSIVRDNVVKVELDASCDKLHEPVPGSHGHTYILKTYTGSSGRKLYDNERKALTALQDQPNDHIVGFYGSFTQGDTYNLVFEYVDGGNLLEFFKSTPPPTSPQDKHDFWTSYKGIFEGAHRIHQLTTHHDHNNMYCIVHQDIKPENILLKLTGETSKYRFQAKIADFGYSHIRSVNLDGCDKLGLDRQGSQMYSAPECSHHELYLQRGTNRITEQADVFSLGCVTSDAASWVVSGHNGRMKYHQNRLAETDTIDSFKGSGYGGCFHNGVRMLNAVQDMHTVIKSLVPHDQITSGIVDIVETDMLHQHPPARLPARQLKEKFGHILNGYVYAQTGPSYQSLRNPPRHVPGLERLESDESVIQATEAPFSPVDSQTTPTRPSSSPFPSRPMNPPLSPQLTPDTDRARKRKPSKSSSNVERLKMSISSFKKSLTNRNSPNPTDPPASSPPSSIEPPTLTLKEVVNWREDKKASRNVDPVVDSRIKSLQSQLNGRDHLFFIDDSVTMSKMSPEVLKAFETMSYLAKSIDPDALELSFASKPTKLIRNTSTTPLVNALSTHQYSLSSTLMEQSMDQYVDNVLMPRLSNWLRGRTSFTPAKLISVFVFTDGAWGQNREKAAGVQQPIARLMDKIQQRKLSRTQVMIQFVRFGDDADGHRYLNYLDVFGKEKACDIVDTKPWRDVDLWAMFIGSICEEMDGKDESLDEMSCG